MQNYKEITIKWSYPMEYDKVLQGPRKDDVGLYYISRVFGDNETLLYIGKTTNSFKSRLSVHKQNFIDQYRGKKLVRLGEIVEPEGLSSYELKGYINDAEKTIIFYLANETDYELPENVTSRNNTFPDEDLIIHNTGYRGVLDKTIIIPEEYDVE